MVPIHRSFSLQFFYYYWELEVKYSFNVQLLFIYESIFNQLNKIPIQVEYVSTSESLFF